jgi:hypothetical protein
VKRALILVLVGAGIVTLILGCERSAKKASSTQLPLIPETDPLAQPKSLRQVGAPVELSRGTIPSDNPQTPEKISLGQRLFFDLACRLTALSRAAHAMIPRLPSPTGSPHLSASKAA